MEYDTTNSWCDISWSMTTPIALVVYDGVRQHQQLIWYIMEYDHTNHWYGISWSMTTPIADMIYHGVWQHQQLQFIYLSHVLNCWTDLRLQWLDAGRPGHLKPKDIIKDIVPSNNYNKTSNVAHMRNCCSITCFMIMKDKTGRFWMKLSARAAQVW